MVILHVDGNSLEPFIYKNQIKTVMHTHLNDEHTIYEIEKGKVVYLETMDHDMNRAYITYENGLISEITYSCHKFGMFAIGDLAPNLCELI
jgi:hypothetical protein